MKRLSEFLVALCLIVSLLPLAAFAAQSATLSVTTSKDAVVPGDTFTVTVNTSAIEGCTNGGFLFAYDEDVFEYVSGTQLAGLSGFTAGISTAAGNIAGYFMNSNATVQGNIFQITLKVKEDAAAGTYSISGTPSINAGDEAVSCNVNGATITVDCKHNYSSWTDAGELHSKTCSICQDVQTEAHTFVDNTCSGCGKAAATQSATVTVSASKETVVPGDTFTVTVSASAVENCTSGGFLFAYDEDVFEYVSGAPLSGLDGFTGGISTAAGNVAGYFMNGNATVEGDIFQIVLSNRLSASFEGSLLNTYS